MTEDFFTLDRESNEQTLEVMIDVIKGDITKVEVDVIVNAAHEGLTGGGGVDGAIHNAAGQQLLGECLNTLYGCGVGEARLTGAYNLPAKYICHTVGPVWTPNKEEQESAKELLASCYEHCLELAERQGMKSIAFPCISTGAYCFPKDLAAEIAIQTIYRWFRSYIMHVKNKKGSYLDQVYIVCFDDENLKLYEQALEKEQNHWTFPECHRDDSLICSYNVGGECRFRNKCWMDKKFGDKKVWESDV